MPEKRHVLPIYIHRTGRENKETEKMGRKPTGQDRKERTIGRNYAVSGNGTGSDRELHSDQVFFGSSFRYALLRPCFSCFFNLLHTAVCELHGADPNVATRTKLVRSVQHVGRVETISSMYSIGPLMRNRDWGSRYVAYF